MTFRVHIALYFVHAFFFIVFPSSLLLSISGQFYPKFSSSAFRILSLSSSLSSLVPSPIWTNILYLNLEFMYDRLLFSLLLHLDSPLPSHSTMSTFKYYGATYFINHIPLMRENMIYVQVWLKLHNILIPDFICFPTKDRI